MAITYGFIQTSTPANAGKRMDASLINRGGTDIYREFVVLADPEFDTIVARVLDAHPGATAAGSVVRSIEAVPGTAVITAPTMSASAPATILAANTSRKSAIVVNDSDSHQLFVKYGTGAAPNSYTHRIPPLGEREVRYTGQITGRLDAGATDAAVMITELS